VARYVLEFEDTFDSDVLDGRRWYPHYLPQWSSREWSRAHYEVGGGRLRLLIEAGQEPWCPEWDNDVRVSSLQTGVFAGPLGSDVGQHRFSSAAVVREEQPPLRLYTPRYGRVEIRCKALAEPDAMVALWLIGYEDEPERSGELCVCEIFGRDVADDEAGIGMGVHPFGDPSLADDFATERVPIDAREFHVYAAEWNAAGAVFYVDDETVKRTDQSPSYPLQLMLSLYAFGAGEGDADPKVFEVDYVRGYREET
jgi:Glycosyl hydrolases family 16